MTYPGGKNGSGTWQRIISHIPAHRVLVELFGGSAAPDTVAILKGTDKRCLRRIHVQRSSSTRLE